MDTFEHNLPKSALALYVKIYIKKHGKTKDNKILIEATRSWLSLSELNKTQFLKKYNEYQKKIKMAYASYLKNAVPYLKVKKKVTEVETHSLNEGTTLVHTIHNEQIDNMNVEMEQNDQFDNPGYNVENITSVTSHNGLDYEDNIELLNDSRNTNCLHAISIKEPTPPKIISAKQLFNFINENNDNNFTWDNLTQNQKRKYQNALLGIKKKYLAEYKNYLEQLSSEKLYYHFKKTVD